MFTTIASHRAEALRRLIQQFKGKATVEGLITSMVGPIQAIEDALVTLNTLRSIADGEGETLDLIGTIVGLDRMAGESDDLYRERLIAQIKINTSQGEPERLIEAYGVFTAATLILLSEHRASVGLSSDTALGTQAEVNARMRQLERIAPAGVRVDFLSSFPVTDAFAFAGDLPGGGFSDDLGVEGGAFGDVAEFLLPFAFDGSDPEARGFGAGTLDPLVGGGFAA